MLYVRIEIWPHGERSRARLLQEIAVANTGEGDGDKGVYKAAMAHASTFKLDGTLAGPDGDPRQPDPERVWKSVPSGIRHFRRRSPAELVMKAIRALLNA